MDENEEIISFPFEGDELEDGKQVYRTYRMDFQKKRIGGMVDGKEAIMQAIWKILSTVRFAHLIYDDQYGCDFFNKINEDGLTSAYLDSDMPVMLEDALLSDERILGIADFSYEAVSYGSIHISFTACTVYGDLQMEGVITDGS